MLLIGICQLAPALLDLATYKAGSEWVMLNSSFTNNTLFSPILKTNPITVKKPVFLVLTCIVTTSFEGKKLDYKCTRIYHPPSGLGAVSLGVLFLFVRRPFFHQSPSSGPSRVLPALLSLYDPPKGLSWSLHFFPGTPHHHHPLHTPVTKVCPVISQKTSKMVHAPQMCSRRHVHTIPHRWP